MGEQSPVAVAISVMLLGSIGFQITLVYLVNYNDHDIRFLTWKVISQTISIFLAVMMFQAVNGMVEEYVMVEGHEMWEIGVDVGHMVFWLSAMNLVIAITSGAVNEVFHLPDPDMKDVKLNAKSFAVLFAHLAGFASINAWGSLQQNIFKSGPWLSFLVVPIGLVGLLMVFAFFGKIRDHIANSDDGEVDKFEKMWDEETKESEDDVAGLALSFLAVQSIRYRICGVLPNQEGMEGEVAEQGHSTSEWEVLVVVGIVSFLVSLAIGTLKSKFFGAEEEEHEGGEHGAEHGALEHGGGEHGGGEKHEGKEEEEEESRLERAVTILSLFFTFAFAWCVFFGAKWAVCGLQFTSEHALLSVSLALLLSSLAFIGIFFIDYLMDHDLLGDGKLAEDACRGTEAALGILIGFSWEQCFDTAVTVIAEGQDRVNPVITKLFMSIGLVIVVFPAWRMHILPKQVQLEEENKDSEKVLLREASTQHYSLLMDKDVDDHVLDRAHLKLKEHFRNAHTQAPVRGGKHLTHLSVTTAGITEVVHEVKKKKTGGHMKESDLKQNLLE